MDLSGFGMQPTGTKLLSKMVCSDGLQRAAQIKGTLSAKAPGDGGSSSLGTVSLC